MPAVVAGRIRGILFDLWNTLVYNDHRPNPIVALGEAFGLLDRPGWPKEIERAMMRESLPGIREGIAALRRATGAGVSDERAEELARIWRQACRRTRPFPDVPEALARLGGRFRLGILSNTQSFDLGFLDRPPFEGRFFARLFSYEVGILKPDPALFLRMAERMQLSPSRLLMVGDNLRDDILAAEAVGMQALLVRRPQAPLSFEEISPDRDPLASLDSVIELLEP